MKLPAEFAAKMRAIFGDTGRYWVDGFPETYDECVSRWALTEIIPYPDLSINFVAKAMLPGAKPVVLKIGVPEKEHHSEVEILRLLAGEGYVKLLDYAPRQGAMLLEYADPGTPLAEVEDDTEATTIAATVLKASFRPPPPKHSLPHVKTWADGLSKLRPHFQGGTGPFPPHYVDLAVELFNELFDTSESDILIHGDYHHWNILRAERVPWLIIDPKGLVGPPGYEIGQFLHNFPRGPEHMDYRGSLMSERVNIFSSILGIPRSRLIKWGFAQTILSAWWSVEDGGDCRATIECASALYPYLDSYHRV